MLPYEKVIQGHLKPRSISVQLGTTLACRLPEELFLPLHSHDQTKQAYKCAIVAQAKVTG